jgi:hypothetical protein
MQPASNSPFAVEIAAKELLVKNGQWRMRGIPERL